MTDRLSTPKSLSVDGPLSEAEIRARRAEAAKRALTEAEARHAAEKNSPLPKERGGRNGPEPTRFGDWEKKGMICDF